MDKLFNFDLSNRSQLSQELLNLGISNFNDALIYIQNLPYGRNSNRSDYSLILKEQKGTCSTKHAFLAALAKQEGKSEIKLYVGIYKMYEKNTPGVAGVLEKWQLPYVPEAHCYLKINDTIVDVTKNNNSNISFKSSLLFEEEILSHQIGDYKVMLHQTFLKSWLTSDAILYDFKTLWQIREACIISLSK